MRISDWSSDVCSSDLLPHERLSPRSDTIGQRLAVLRRITHPAEGEIQVVVAPVRSVLQPQVKGLGDLAPVEVRKGDTVEIADTARRLSDAAHTRVALVERRGEYAVRGGLVDFFPPTEAHPPRNAFLGDDLAELPRFPVAGPPPPPPRP